MYIVTVDLYLLPEVRQSLVDSRYSLREIVFSQMCMVAYMFD